MYRLSGPNLIIFIPIVIIGIVCVTLTPTYFNVTRVLSLFALLIGEAGLSFIPILAFYPKARLVQAIILAIIYFFTTLIICFSVWGINGLGIPGESAFLIKDSEFHINIYALFASNLISLIVLILNFKLVYDEELTKEFRAKNKNKYQHQQSFAGFSQARPKRPDFDNIKESVTSDKVTHKPFNEPGLEEDFLKAFEFEPQSDFSPESLPEESSGKLFYSDALEKSSEAETIEKKIESKKANPFPPQNIKDDLQAIFEQYSSLNAVKKLTSGITDKPHLKRKEYEKRSTRKPYILPKTQMSVEIKDEDVHEASFRPLNEQDKLNEIKEELKKELKAEIQKEKKDESEKTEDKTQEKIYTKEESLQTKNVEEIKEDLIKSIKDELIESLKQEIKKELIMDENIKDKPLIKSDETLVQEEEEEDDIKELEQQLGYINNEAKLNGSIFLKQNGTIIAENWKEKSVLHKEDYTNLLNEFNFLNKQINKTNQGSVYHILLESDNGTLVLANSEDKLLTVYSKGTGEANSGQILRTLIEAEEN